MNRSLFLLAVLTICGCTAPLEKESVSTQVAQDAEIVASEVRHVFGGEFTVTSIGTLEGIWVYPCVIVLTDTELFVYVEKQDEGTREQDLRVPYSAMRGIACLEYGRGYQTQILGDVGILAVQVTDGGPLIDQAASRSLCDYVRARGVPQFAAEGRISSPTGPTMIWPIF